MSISTKLPKKIRSTDKRQDLQTELFQGGVTSLTYPPFTTALCGINTMKMTDDFIYTFLCCLGLPFPRFCLYMHLNDKLRIRDVPTGGGGGRHAPNVYEYARNKILSANHPNFQFMSAICAIILSQSRVTNSALLHFFSFLYFISSLKTVIAKLKGYFKDISWVLDPQILLFSSIPIMHIL